MSKTQCFQHRFAKRYIYCIKYSIYSINVRGGSRAAATSKMERFVIIVNGWKPLTIITKRSILDVAAVLDPPLNVSPYYKYLLCLLVVWKNMFQITNFINLYLLFCVNVTFFCLNVDRYVCCISFQENKTHPYYSIF